MWMGVCLPHWRLASGHRIERGSGTWGLQPQATQVGRDFKTKRALLANASDAPLIAPLGPDLQGTTPLRLPQEKAMRQQQMTRLIHSLPQLTHHQRQQLASCLQALLDHSQAIAVL